MIIFNGAGHTITGVGTGAVGIKKETDLNRLVVRKLSSMFRAAGHTVIEAIIDKSNTDIRDRTRLENQYNCDLALEFHLNSFKSNAANGVECYTINKTTKAFRYAQEIQKELVNRIGWTDRGVKQANFQFLRETKAPAVLVELGFCTNAEDMRKFDVDKICRAVFKAITGVDYQGGNNTQGGLKTVQVGAFRDENNANRLKEKLKADGYTDVFIKEV